MVLIDKNQAYEGQEKVLLAVDCIVFGFDSKELKLLLFKRPVQPLKDMWSLVGAFIKNNSTLEEEAEQILLESTGLDDVYLEELKTYSKIDRDPGERVISVSYFSLIRIDDYEIKSVEKFDAHWFTLDEIPELILDHNQMVKDAISNLRQKAKYEPIGFNLLPEKFTIPQLQNLYECIYQKKLDNRNFRKKILSFDVLVKTNDKDKSTSKKRSFSILNLTKKKFDLFISKGHNFEI